MESLIPEYSAFGAVREAAGSALPGIAPSNAYPCRDGYVLVAGNGHVRTTSTTRVVLVAGTGHARTDLAVAKVLRGDGVP
eukprot:gene44051-58745_t